MLNWDVQAFTICSDNKPSLPTAVLHNGALFHQEYLGVLTGNSMSFMVINSTPPPPILPRGYG